ncbi:hypothetical protein ACSS6W_000765 [Trichoderma asperelloides]|uniref:Uncharacterized protein n=1 Tax=Trichoderma asperellum TaxID=101201 RepID=A0A6V8QM10_TRIAP|nr:hypothetical protein LI328DRAFT_144202 [Trichoderma asperelloides]GFP53269.1 hypothetical protein TASIC1_0002045300 [Trichoderma asperellum]
MNPETPEKPSAIWTDEAKFQFLLRIVAQLKEDGRSIKWDKINLPGRTVKSLQNMWTKINKQIADFEAQDKNGEPTPRKRGRPTKKASKGVDMDGGAVDDDFDIKQEFFKKRGAEELDDEEPTPALKRAKVKTEVNDTIRVKKENNRQY